MLFNADEKFNDLLLKHSRSNSSDLFTQHIHIFTIVFNGCLPNSVKRTAIENDLYIIGEPLDKFFS